MPALQVVVGPQREVILAPRRRREDSISNPLTLDVSKVIMHLVVLWETLCDDLDGVEQSVDLVLMKYMVCHGGDPCKMTPIHFGVAIITSIKVSISYTFPISRYKLIIPRVLSPAKYL